MYLFLSAADSTGAAGGGASMILMFVVLIAVFYFFMIRPENKRKKEAQQMRDSLKVGDNITTIGGIIGDIITFRATMGNAGPENWSMEAGSTWFFDKQKAAMGALSDLGIHKVDLLQYLTGQKVIETTAKVMTLNKHTATGAPITVDDNALCILRMSGGAVGTLAASWTVYGHECQSTCLYGTKGIMLIYNNNNPAAPIEVRNLDGTSTTYNIPPETNSGVIDEFVDALEHDREPEVSGKEALSTMRAIFGSIKSSEIGRTVSVNDSYVNHL